jgi:hypothetical protein
MSSDENKYELYRTQQEDQIRKDFAEHFQRCPIKGDELLANLGLFLTSKHLSRILFMDYLYRQIVDNQGIVFEFGTRWGQNLALFSSLRGIYEPFNRHRKVVGFDTFAGFPGVTDKDARSHQIIKKGGFATTDNYVDYLSKTMGYIEQDNPNSHIRKFDLRVGDATIEIDNYLKEFPETIVALAYFDLDIYEPTLKCLEAIKPHLTKGSILGFDELNDHDSPGETVALMEAFGLNNIKLKRYRYASRVSYFVLE